MIEFHYTVIRRPRRKTATISVSRDNRVCIAVPKHLSHEGIEEIIQRKANWIRAKLELNAQSASLYKPRRYVAGEHFPFLGRTYPLVVREGSAGGVALGEEGLSVRISPNLEAGAREQLIAALLRRWYVSRASETIGERVGHYEGRLQARPRKIAIKDLRSRWGSCSIRGNLSFSWKLVMAPLEVLDYVVVHEMCHLIEHNHSARYWDLVRSIMPEYKARQQWLKANGDSLEW